MCNYPDEHKREGREDYDRYGRYGYDREKYDDRWNDCNKAYTDGFNERREEEDRRQERYEQEQREERRQMVEARERREMQQAEEDAYWDSIFYQQEPQHPEPPQQEQPDDLPF